MSVDQIHSTINANELIDQIQKRKEGVENHRLPDNLKKPQLDLEHAYKSGYLKALGDISTLVEFAAKRALG